MQIPAEPKTGEPVTAAWGAQVVRALRAIWPRPSADIFPNVGGGGTTYVMRPRRDRGGGATTPATPLQPVDASVGAEPAVTITPGTFGGNIPASAGADVPTIDSVRIDRMTEADPPVPDPPRLVLGADDELVYLQVNVSGGQITGCEVHSTEDNNPPDNEPGTLYVRLASVIVTITEDDPPVASVSIGPPNLRGSQAYQLCGTAHLYGLT